MTARDDAQTRAQARCRIQPLGEAKEDAWQIMEVARRMGMEHLFPWPEDDWHTGSMTRRVKELHQAMPAAYVEVNRADAIKLGISADQRVKVVSRHGELTLPVKVDDRGRPPQGTVFIPFFDEGKLVNRLTLDAMDNISKEPVYKNLTATSLAA